MENQEKKFIEGLYTSRRENAPDFVLANLSFKTDRFIEWLKNNTNAKGYCNVDVLKLRDGAVYSKHNDWKPKENTQNDNFEIPNEIKVEDLPF